MKLFSIISPSANIFSLSQICRQHDAILLRQDGVFLSLKSDIAWPTSQLYVLETDVTVRQIQPPPYFAVVNDAQWVELCITAKQNLLWNT